MYLPTDPTLVTAVCMAHEATDRKMQQSWTILAHNYAVDHGYYDVTPGTTNPLAVKIDWEAWVERQYDTLTCTQDAPHWIKGSGLCPLH